MLLSKRPNSIYFVCFFVVASSVFGCRSSKQNLAIADHTTVQKMKDASMKAGQETSDAINKAHHAGVPPDLIVSRENAARKAMDARMTYLYHKKGLSREESVRLMKEAQQKDKVALRKMRESLYKDDYKPNW